MGARTDAARQEALAARTALDVEVARLQAAARAAVDVRAQVRRHPGKAAGAAAGAAFVAVGGPKRVIRAVKRRVRGEPEPLPASLLPGEIEKAVSALGSDGAKVRGAIERSFRQYLDATAKDRKAEARERSLVRMARKVVVPVATMAARRAISRAMADRDRDAEAGGAVTPSSPAGNPFGGTARKRGRRG